jgi:hypothetical protein
MTMSRWREGGRERERVETREGGSAADMIIPW